MIVPVNASKGYVQDDYGSIFQQLPNSKLKYEITVFKKYLYDEHWVMYVCVESLNCIPKTNIILLC